VDTAELVFGALLVLLLLGVAGFFAWRQLVALRSLRKQVDLSREDQRFLRQQALRRLLCCGLTLALALMLACWPILEGPVSHVTRADAPPPVDGQAPQLDRADARAFVLYWIVFMLLVLATLVLAAVDLLAVGRYGLRQHRQLEAERKAVLQSEVARLRSRRNGYH
jgi:hypothetical protein